MNIGFSYDPYPVPPSLLPSGGAPSPLFPGQSLYPPPPELGATEYETTRKVSVINGYQVETDSGVRLLTGPVVGEVTADAANILLEVDTQRREHAMVNIEAVVYKVSFITT